MSTNPKGFLTLASLSQGVIKAEYAVRGTMAIRAKQIKDDLAKGIKYPFTEVTECNVGNPQVFGQTPLTFNRQVLSAMMNPELLRANFYHKDIIKRTEYYLNKMGCGMGAYSDSAGHRVIKENVCKFLEKRDGHKAYPENIFMTDGVTLGLHMVLQALISGPNDGLMIPVPQYPLYTAILALNNANAIPYYLNEQKGWGIDMNKLQESYDENTRKGINVKAICIINPGNPTGQVLKEHELQQIVEFAYKNKLAILADEVYQQNVYKDGVSFVSAKKVVAANKDKPVDLISFNSASKGLLGECGLRGGYFEVHNMRSEVVEQIQKLRTMYVCSNTTGQIIVDLMVNPPTREDNATEIVEQYEREKRDLMNSLKNRAHIVTEYLKKMKNVTCNEVEGAMYAFPRLHLSQKAIDEAKARKMKPDLFYTMEALEKTGIVLVPGSGFEQEPGTYHHRITTLILPDEKLKNKMQDLYKFNEDFHNKYN